MPVSYDIPQTGQLISPVDFTIPPDVHAVQESIAYPYTPQTTLQTVPPAPHEAAPVAVTPESIPVSWPESDVDEAARELSPDMAQAVHNLAVLSLSNEIADIERFASLYRVLDAVEKTAFESRRNALVEERMQRPQTRTVQSSAVPAERQPQTEAPRPGPEVDPIHAGPHLIELVPQSLALTRSPAFQSFYSNLSQEAQFVFDRQAFRDWEQASGQYGAAALNAIGIREPKKRWVALNPEITPPSYDKVVGLFTTLQDRQN